MLRSHGFSEQVVLAGLPHDIVEDGDFSTDKLLARGFVQEVVALVDLCSHDSTVSGSEARWVKMISRLIDANSREAWAIKIADITSNLRSCHTMPVEKQRFMKEVKATLMLRLTDSLLGESMIWRELSELVSE
jgi:(p)ppGpp synthase/HD superfamily hydrolase